MVSNKTKTLVIGLTGGPGVGKSEVAGFLKMKNALVINADAIGHEILAKSDSVKRKLVKLLGREIVSPDGSLNRSIIGRKVFGNRELMYEFNRIIHPPLLRQLKKRIVRAASKQAKLIVVDAALIFEWGIADWFDFILVVHARRAVRLRRLSKEGLSVNQASRRIASQMPQRDKLALADFVIENNSTRAVLRRKISKFINKLEENLVGRRS